MCVGLDYFGDELHYPHCSFAHRNFTNFLMEERKRRNGHFGFRIHAGELYKYENKELLYTHMGVVSFNICTILEQYEAIWKHENITNPKPNTNVPPPLRIGHGIGFLSFLEEGWATAPTTAPSTTESNSIDQLHSAVLRALRKIHDLRIPIEVNLTSDRCLLGTGQMGSAANAVGVFNPDTLYTFLKKGFCVVVCTDNDGILRLQLDGYHSVAAELLRACRGTNADTALQSHEVMGLLENYEHAAFGWCDDEKPTIESKPMNSLSQGLCRSCFGNKSTVKFIPHFATLFLFGPQQQYRIQPLTPHQLIPPWCFRNSNNFSKVKQCNNSSLKFYSISALQKGPFSNIPNYSKPQ